MKAFFHLLPVVLFFMAPSFATGVSDALSISQRLETAIEMLAGDECGGRYTGSACNERARKFVTDWMKRQNLVPLPAIGQFEHAFPGGVNILGMKYPADGSADHPAIMLSAHLDSVGPGCGSHSEALSNHCNGASDNAAGVAVCMAVLENLQHRGPIILAFWDAEEKGLAGSRAFVEQYADLSGGLRLLINLDIIGLNLFHGLENRHFVIGAATGGSELKADVAEAFSGSDLQAISLSYAFGHNRSDMTSFINSIRDVPFVFFSDGDGAVYHTNADEPHHLNMDKVASLVPVIANVVALAENRVSGYTYRKPRSQGTFFLPVYPDAEALHGLTLDLLSNADANDLSKAQMDQLTEMAKRLELVIEAGESGFGIEQTKYLSVVAGLIQRMSLGL